MFNIGGDSLKVKQGRPCLDGGSNPTSPLQKSHQRIIREQKEKESVNALFSDKPDEIDLKTAIVKPITNSTAKGIIEDYEWLGCMPTIVWFTYGIFFDGVCGGVVVYGAEYSENLGHWDKYGYTGKMILLARGACVYWTPTGTASKLIMRSIKMLPEKYEVVTATVDSLAGEIGTIYQACGFHYVGSMRDSNPNIKNKGGARFGVKINGHLFGSRAMRAKVGSQKKADILKMFPTACFIPQFSKHRYFYFRGTTEQREQHKKAIAHLIKPYPKRDTIGG